MQENVKQAGLFLIKAVVFSLIFCVVLWVMWGFVLNTQTSSSSCNNQVQAESTGQDAATKKYMEYMTKAEEQQQRMDSILTRQEQQSKRLDAILSTWERQGKIAK